MRIVLSRILAGRGVGTRRRHLSRLLAKRQRLEDRAKTLEQPVDKCGCNGLRIFFCEEVQKMKSFRSVEHPSRVGEDTGLLKRRSQTTALARDWAKKTTREGSQFTPSPIIKRFFVSLFAVVHAAEYTPIAWHRAQGAFIPKGATAASW